MRYIGGKALLTNRIIDVIKEYTADVKSVLDIFAGSGAVSVFLKSNDYKVTSNDILYFSYVLQRAAIGINYIPKFKSLGINDPLQYLNTLTLEEADINVSDCFMYNNYSPANSHRMYFQEKNALKIDIIRITIERWYRSGLLNEEEYFYLLACLINAVPYVSNITGVYAAYLKFWDNRTYNDLELKNIEITKGIRTKSCCYNVDYKQLLNMKKDLLYADPPYNSREYLPNYHILETIAKYDYPIIHGVTGMREYDNQKSPFCKKKLVESAFETMVKETRCKYVLISYNNEGLISTHRLSEICQTYAKDDSFRLFEFPYRRYKNKIPNNTAGLKEQLYLLKKY